MKITERDIELMGWILEQKFMTEKQVRQVFWKGTTKKSRNAYKRMNELQKAGFLRTNDKSTYREAIYTVSTKGIRELRAFNRNRGLGETSDVGYTNYKHDSVVTDIRIMFHGWGYTDWVSERVLSKRNDLRQVPDGMIFHRDRYTAIEYESSQKSKHRYREIFNNYEFDRHVDQVLYIVGTPELAEKVSKEASLCSKLYFVSLGDIERDQTSVMLRSDSGMCSLRQLLETTQNIS